MPGRMRKGKRRGDRGHGRRTTWASTPKEVEAMDIGEQRRNVS